MRREWNETESIPLADAREGFMDITGNGILQLSQMAKFLKSELRREKWMVVF